MMVDHERMTVAYQQNIDWLVGLIYGRVQAVDLAQDIAQDTFERLLKRPADVLLQEQENIRAYLSTIARGLVIDNWRRREIEQRFLLQLAIQHIDLQPDAQMALLESLYQVDQLIRQLAPKVRLSFIYVHIYGMTYKEVASALGLTERTIKNYMAQAMLHCLKMKAELEND